MKRIVLIIMIISGVFCGCGKMSLGLDYLLGCSPKINNFRPSDGSYKSGTVERSVRLLPENRFFS